MNKLNELFDEAQAAAHKFLEALRELEDHIEELDPGEEHDALQNLRGIIDNARTEAEWIADGTDCPVVDDEDPEGDEDDEDPEDDDEDAPLCPVCDGDGVPLGQLGPLMHWRCRQCGVDFSNEAKAA